jgi:dienelactone hydrolase
MNMKITEFAKWSPSMEYYNLPKCIDNYVKARSIAAFDRSDSDRDSIENIIEFEERRAFLKGKFIEMLGGLPETGQPAKFDIIGVEQFDGFKVEKIIFESRPNTFVSANVYIPDGIVGKTGAVIFASGHYEDAKHSEEYHTVCQYMVKAGLIVLAQDPIGQGERVSYYEKNIDKATIEWGVGEHTYAGLQCVAAGEGIAKYFVHDLMRGVDYLIQRPDVDSGNIGITGNSGGGTQTSLLMTCDDRIKAAAPGTFITSRRAFLETDSTQDSEQIWPGMSALGFDHEDLLLSMAPKPVMVVAVDYDFFPIEGTRQTVERCKRFWNMYNERDNLEGDGKYEISLFTDQSAHYYTRRMAQASAEFFSYHLNGQKVTVKHEDVKCVDLKKLLCTSSGILFKEDKYANSRIVVDETIDVIASLKANRSANSDEENIGNAKEWLKNIVFANRESVESNPRILEDVYCNNYIFTPVIWRTQKWLWGNAYIIRKIKYKGMNIPATICLWEGGTKKIQSHIEKIDEITSAGHAAIVVDLTGDGANSPSEESDRYFGKIYKYGADLFWLNESFAAIRTYDLITAVNIFSDFEGIEKNSIELYSEKRFGYYVLMAALLDDSAKKYSVCCLPKSIEEDFAGVKYYNEAGVPAFIIPGMLKYFDMPELLQWTKSK